MVILQKVIARIIDTTFDIDHGRVPIQGPSRPGIPETTGVSRRNLAVSLCCAPHEINLSGSGRITNRTTTVTDPGVLPYQSDRCIHTREIASFIGIIIRSNKTGIGKRKGHIEFAGVIVNRIDIAVNITVSVRINKPQDLTMLILERMNLTGHFPVVWGGEAGKPLKPAAACLRNVCVALGVSPGETIMVGDSLTDVEAARAAGCPVIVVAHGYEQRPLDSLGADAVCTGLAETADEINRRLARGQSRLRWPA